MLPFHIGYSLSESAGGGGLSAQLSGQCRTSGTTSARLSRGGCLCQPYLEFPFILVGFTSIRVKGGHDDVTVGWSASVYPLNPRSHPRFLAHLKKYGSESCYKSVA